MENGSIFNRAKETMANVKNKIAERGSIAIFVILAMVCIALIIAFLIIKMRGTNMTGTTIVSTPLKLYNMGSQATLDSSKVPPTVNGQQYTFSFWLYMTDFVQTADAPQLIFMRSTTSTNTTNAGFIAAFSPLTNKLNFAVRTNKSSNFDPLRGDLEQKKGNSAGYVVSSISYVPLQRWVHIAAVVKDENLSIYMNGTMYTTATLSDVVTDPSSNDRPVFAGSSGGIIVGAAGVQDMRDTRAYIAQFKYFNYALPDKTIKSVYTAGPNAMSFLARLGITGYGLRSPIYKVDT